MVKKASNAVTVQHEKQNSLSNVPDYLVDKSGTSGLNLDQSDFKMPRIKLLEALSPEVQSFSGEAIPGEFWHTGANRSLGTEFIFVPLIVSKRIILWNTRENGGGILALSRDGKNWASGGNQEFTVKIKGQKQPVIWKTSKSVKDSGLLEWGSSNPDDNESGPAAQVHYEYLIYLIDHPELSPVVMGVTRTGAVNAKSFNTQLLVTRKPIQAIKVRCFADEKSNNQGTWHVPNFSLQGFVSKDLFDLATSIAEKQQDYTTEYEAEGGAPSEDY